MIPNMRMCRETRIILEEFDNMASKYGVTNLVTPYHVYLTDRIVLKYYTNPMLNVIHSKMKSIHNISSKHFNIEYWEKIFDKMFSINRSVLRDDYVEYIKIDTDSFTSISKYETIDYSINECKIIHAIINENTTISIHNAIKIACNNNVYNTYYIKTILDRNNAEYAITQENTKKIISMIDKSSDILNEEKVVNTPIDIAVAQYNWKIAQENAELEKKMLEFLGGNDEKI